MTDEEIRKVICEYVCAEMELLPNEGDIPEHPPYSKRFNRKMKRLLKAGDYFGGNIRVYTIVRRVAAVLIIILSLTVANQVSAAVFGVEPWKAIVRVFAPENIMTESVYRQNDNQSEKVKQPISDFPTYIPDGYAVKEKQKEDTYDYIEWTSEKEPDNRGIVYTRDSISKEYSVVENSEYQRKKIISIAGYKADMYFDNDEVWLTWFDSNNIYMIQTKGVDKAEKSIKLMAESIYV
ncbi:MAG: DUF4367 domain-containing protein [Eubacterium sp.]|nr:DUF4367 domain-containing protein [Eubacterium sp.]